MLADSKLWKRVKAWWDLRGMVVGLLTLVGMISGSAGYFGNDYMRKVPPAKPVPTICPKQPSVIEQITCPKVVCGCDAAIKEHAKDSTHQEHY